MTDAGRKVPRNLNECYVTDNTANRLWKWSNWLERAGEVFCWIIAIAWVIVSISSAMVPDYYGNSEFSFLVFITSIITWAIYAFLEYCGFIAVAWLIEALGTIIQNLKITASVALYNSAKEEGWLDSEETAKTSFGGKTGYLEPIILQPSW